jgi:uncharacterized protein (TIGR02145 family)
LQDIKTAAHKIGAVMKTIIAFFILSSICFAQQPEIRFYLDDGTVKEYNINEIDDIHGVKFQNNYEIRLFRNNQILKTFQSRDLEKIDFTKNIYDKVLVNFHIYEKQISFFLHTIDSIIFIKNNDPPIKEVKIGNQIWMAENLNVSFFRNGDPINQAYKAEDWVNAEKNGTPPLCSFYNFDSTKGRHYGRLYNLAAIFDGREIAPWGWHIPRDTEWEELIEYLGGSSIAGGKLKATGTREKGNGFWVEPNSGATNESGFNLLPGGVFLNNWGEFSGEGYQAYLYRGFYPNLSGFYFPCLFFIFNDATSIDWYCDYDCIGFSVRCIKD